MDAPVWTLCRETSLSLLIEIELGTVMCHTSLERKDAGEKSSVRLQEGEMVMVAGSNPSGGSYGGAGSKVVAFFAAL